MEKLDKPQTKSYGPCVIWANDLDNILYELKDCEKIEFIADDVKYDSVDEFIIDRHEIRPSELTIRTQNPYLTIDLDPLWAKLYVSSSKLLESGLFLKVDSILSKCERTPRISFTFWPPLVIIWIASGVFFLEVSEPHGYLIILMLLILIAWTTYVAYIRAKKFTTIYPVRRENKPSFITRNIDSIVIAIISAILGAAVGAAATKIADNMWPNSPSNEVEINTPPQSSPQPSL